MYSVIGYHSTQQHPDGLHEWIKDMYRALNEEIQVQCIEKADTFCLYNCLNGEESQKHRYDDPRSGLTCVVIGNIHAYDNDGLKLLTGEHIAKFVIEQYLSSGVDFAKYLRGIFNILIFENDRVLLINDTLGLSPLYTYPTDHGVYFSSEADALTWLNVSNSVNWGAVADFLIYGFVTEGKTFIDGLENQPPGTAVEIKQNTLSITPYTQFQEADLSGMSEAAKVQAVRDAFQESVRIRLHQYREETFTDLTGGWDTRFILANLRELTSKVIAHTSINKSEDLAIATKIAKGFNVEHLIDDMSFDFGGHPRLFLDLQSGAQDYLTDYLEYKKDYKNRYRPWVGRGFLAYPRFRGVFGGEILGGTPPWYNKRIGLNPVIDGDKILTRSFLKESLKFRSKKALTRPFDESFSPPYHFLNQVARSYLTTLYVHGWERPTNLFNYHAIMPFTDHKFVGLICGLKDQKYMNYRLYEVLYKKFYPEYFSYPWTFLCGRRENNLDEPADSLRNRHSVKNEDPGFREFLNRQTFIKNKTLTSERSKELYFLYHWLNIYRPVLDSSAIGVYMGEQVEA